MIKTSNISKELKSLIGTAYIKRELVCDSQLASTLVSLSASKFINMSLYKEQMSVVFA